MNCPDWQERIALYAGGDLSEREAADVGRHLADCGQCREFLEGIEASQAFVREVHQENVPSAAPYEAVRARVLERIESRRRRAWFLGWTAGLAAAAIILMLLLLPRPPAVEPVQFALKPPEAPPIAPRARPIPHHRRSRMRPAVPAEVPAAEPLVVKLITDDPDVVIYWIMDNQGD
jgi:anti-sigma factor RsiW